VVLTGSGQAILEKALPLWKAVQKVVEKDLGPDRFDRLLHDLSATVGVAQAG